ncbi:MAG: ACP S-malonyltransferase [bacterium]
MGKIAFIFPGQGSQHVGMGLDFYNSSDTAKNIFNKFNVLLKKDISKLCFEGPEENLKQTVNTQPAILAVSIVGYSLLKEKMGINPDFIAGHSLGEYAALYAAGVIKLEDVILLVQKRAELMSKAQSGSMSAILGLNIEKIAELVQKASDFGIISVANYNTPDQIVITGEEKAIEYANNTALELGAKRVVPLAVSGAFHSALMKSASEEYAKYIENININNADIPVITNVDAKPTSIRSEFINKIIAQMHSSVYWDQSINYMLNHGVETFIEIGPGKILSGMIRKISRSVKICNISDIKTLENVMGCFEPAFSE